ncbi:hypothetical protein M378DRAFT_160406 [Amanita muscaria Koide BX008]|uniref:F-box domain-containing protein n=1 Tax=Amanita muscaria (strain Koide BX008) TaxID=946122 RepID=A0A0C2XDF6_AMAMK|nr:hypothetical protein M378DRAFT_160406 [Amanita muscaria Koide BX008]
MLLRLPVEILRDIVSLIGRRDITEVCRDISTIAHTVPSLWSSIHLGSAQFVPSGPDFLHARLDRTSVSPLTISIGPVTGQTLIIADLCRELSNFSLCIVRLEITTDTAATAGRILDVVFPDLSHGKIFPELQALSVRVTVDVDAHSPGPYRAIWPKVDRVLESATSNFPGLRTLSISSFFDCIPVLPDLSSFSHLHTLILDGSGEEDLTDIILIVALLHSTPQLETLWIKHFFREHFVAVTNPNVPGTIKGRKNPRLHVVLPHLTSLAVTVPGCALELLRCIEAPALRNLHLDGSRAPDFWDFPSGWTNSDTSSVRNALERFAQRAPNLRHLAVTAVLLTHPGWEWLLFGNEGREPPFLQLETIALHQLHDKSLMGIECGFDDALLMRYAKERPIALRRLVIHQCNIPLTASSVIEAFRGAMRGGRRVPCELEYDPRSINITEEEVDILARMDVRLICRQEEAGGKWWTGGHERDASDSHAY